MCGFACDMAKMPQHPNSKKPYGYQRTLSIIKPDAVSKNVIGQIYARFRAAGLKIAAAHARSHLSRRGRAVLQCAQGAPLLQDLVSFMIFRP